MSSDTELPGSHVYTVWMQKWRGPCIMKSCNMNSSHTEFQMVFSAEEVSLELQALGELGFTGAMYFGIKLVSVLLRE